MNNTQKTWVDPEEVAYPSGGFHRKGRVLVAINPHNPVELPYGEIRAIKASIPDTFFSIPAKLRHKKQTIIGFLSYSDNTLTFKPEADPKRCLICVKGDGCKIVEKTP